MSSTGWVSVLLSNNFFLLFCIFLLIPQYSSQLIIQSCVRIQSITGLNTALYDSSLDLSLTANNDAATTITTSSVSTSTSISFPDEDYCFDYDQSATTVVTYETIRAQTIQICINGDCEKYGWVTADFATQTTQPIASSVQLLTYTETISPDGTFDGTITFDLWHQQKAVGYLKISNRNFHVYGLCMDFIRVQFSYPNSPSYPTIDYFETAVAVELYPSSTDGSESLDIAHIATDALNETWNPSLRTTDYVDGNREYCWEPYQQYIIYNLTEIGEQQDITGLGPMRIKFDAVNYSLSYVGDTEYNLVSRLWSFSYISDLPIDTTEHSEWSVVNDGGGIIIFLCIMCFLLIVRWFSVIFTFTLFPKYNLSPLLARPLFPSWF